MGILGEIMTFKLLDRVKCLGVKGTVVTKDSERLGGRYPIEVTFDNGYHFSFTADGKIFPWALEASLEKINED